MKARIIFNLEVSQLITAAFRCGEYKIYDDIRNDISHEYGVSLDMIIPDKEPLEDD